MKRSLWVVSLVAAVGAFALIQQYSSWSLNNPRSSLTAKAAPGSRQDGRGSRRGRGADIHEAVPVRVVTAVRKSVPLEIRAVGTVEAYSVVSVKSQVTGVLTQAHFKEGQDVKKGQLLFTIDPRPFEAALKQAEANLARDNAQLKNLQQQAHRYAELVEKQYVSREQYDQIRTNADATHAVVAADKAAIDNAKVQLSYCYIYAPVNGRVGSLLVNEGNLVRTNDGTPLIVINQINPIYVSFAVPEERLADLKRRMAEGRLQVDASFTSDQGRPEQGWLDFIDNAVDPVTGTIKLKAVFANNERRLWPGQFVNVVVKLATEANVVVIPSEAIQVGQEGQHVFVLKPDNTVEVRPVTLGLTNEGEAVITKGLKAGEVVVREGQFLLGPGSRVEVKEATGTEARNRKAGGETARDARAADQGAS
jgi:multidrug efflux system membrane fusion protein